MVSEFRQVIFNEEKPFALHLATNRDVDPPPQTTAMHKPPPYAQRKHDESDVVPNNAKKRLVASRLWMIRLVLSVRHTNRT